MPRDFVVRARKRKSYVTYDVYVTTKPTPHRTFAGSALKTTVHADKQATYTNGLRTTVGVPCANMLLVDT